MYLQDTPSVLLYAVTRQVTKGGRKLPIYRCARGSTSLGSLHSHIKNFIPGTSANAVNFQAYLLNGVSGLNQARKETAEGRESTVRLFVYELITCINELHASVIGGPLVDKPPLCKNTGQDFGMEYLYKQSDSFFQSTFDFEEIIQYVDYVLELQIPNSVDSGVYPEDELPQS